MRHMNTQYLQTRLHEVPAVSFLYDKELLFKEIDKNLMYLK